jgi:hypothetical protein
MLILELQPAVSASLEGSLARAIRIESCGSVSVAPGLLAKVERPTATSLHVEAESWNRGQTAQNDWRSQTAGTPR